MIYMLRTAHTVSVPSRGNFTVDDDLTIFEVGGKNNGCRPYLKGRKRKLRNPLVRHRCHIPKEIRG